MNEELKIFEALRNHVKIIDIIHHMGMDNLIFSCEVDRIQSVSRGIIGRILSPYNGFKISSSNKGVKNLGFTKILIHKESNEN